MNHSLAATQDTITLEAQGTSMLPLLWPGAQVRVDLKHTPQKGDVVVLYQHRKFVLHRVIDTKGERLLTRGDNRGIDDGWLEEANVLGIVPGVVLFRSHLAWVGPGLRAPFRAAWVAMLPVVRRVFWTCCAISRPFRRALTPLSRPHSFRA